MSLHPITARVELIPGTRLVVLTLRGGPGGGLVLEADQARGLADDLTRAAGQASAAGRGRARRAAPRR